MKKTIITTLAVLSALPIPAALANSAVESCLTEYLSKQGVAAPDSAQVRAVTQYNGFTYTMIELHHPQTKDSPLSIVYVKTSPSGGCDVPLAYQADSFPEKEVYDARLGQPVYSKLFEQLN